MITFGAPRWPAASAPDALTLESQRRALATELYDLEAKASDHARQPQRYPAAHELELAGEKDEGEAEGRRVKGGGLLMDYYYNKSLGLSLTRPHGTIFSRPL